MSGDHSTAGSSLRTVARRSQRPVMADVARLAGVAPMTVSRVINDDVRVAPDTRARVQRAIAELGFRSNRAARTLAGGRSMVIGVIGAKTAFYGPLRALVGIESAARAVGRAVHLTTVGEATVDELRGAFQHLRDAHVDGVIVEAPMRSAHDAIAEIDPGVPFVVIAGGHPSPSSVGVDQFAGGRLATAHLLDRGHHTVHHIGGPPGWIDADGRADGWRAELAARGRDAPPPLAGDWTARSGYAAGQELASNPDVSAVFVANDQMALGAILALREAGRSVPDDVSVVGFDDTPESEFFDPPLTTIRQDLDEVGRRSVKLLLGLLAGDDVPDMDDMNDVVDVEPSLVARRSVAVRKRSSAAGSAQD